MVAGAIEVTESGWGRARLGVTIDAKAPTLQRFIRATVKPGSSVTASGRPAHQSLPAVHRLFAQVKRNLEGTYQGSGSAGHLDEYLDEFIFRFNRRDSTFRGLVFMRLLQRSLAG